MNAESRTIMEFIKNVGEQFVIPVFQRKYEWDKKQLEPLMENLKSLIDDESNTKTHYLGTIVYSKSEDGKKLFIVDGQQRLITLFLIIHALYKISGDKNLTSYLLNKIDEYRGDDKTSRLSLYDPDIKAYETLMWREYDQRNTDNQSKIIRNFNYFKNELQTLIEKVGSTTNVLNALKRFVIVNIELEKNKDNEQQIYESINARGRKLSQSDLFRNFIMMDKDKEGQVEIYKKYWEKLDEHFTNNSKEMEKFLRYYLASVNYRYPKQDDELYSELKKYWEKETRFEREKEHYALRKITKYLDLYKQLYYDDKSNILGNMKSKKYNEREQIIEDIRKFQNGNSAPLILYFYDLYHNTKINDDYFYGVLSVINTYQIRRHFNGNHGGDRDAFPLFLEKIKNVVKQRGDDYKNIIDIVTYVLINNNIGTAKAIPNNDQIIGVLKNKSFNVNDENDAKWLLWKIEKMFYKNLNISSLDKWQLEHFAPVKPTEDWKKELNDGFEYMNIIRTIGNLTLLDPEKNTIASNLIWKDKIEKYQSNDDKTLLNITKDLVLSVEKDKKWNKDKIKERSNELIARFLDIYPYVKSKNSYEVNTISDKNNVKNIFRQSLQTSQEKNVQKSVVESYDTNLIKKQTESKSNIVDKKLLIHEDRVIYLKRNNETIIGYLTDEKTQKIIIFRGATIDENTVIEIHKKDDLKDYIMWTKNIWNKLLSENKIENKNGKWEFVEDSFALSVTQATVLINGFSSRGDGWFLWKDKDDETIDNKFRNKKILIMDSKLELKKTILKM
ncbi:hypothetical protein CJJ23_01120 [Mycoplasmopsis agassizii]|uniref:DUF262 domain-containing protein n=1 Tax=Mycoplasmopsis agassizii TaxID=33922 RepID=A0A269TJH4_9BACT|nr:DUF262 domain-containing protein [Mycoplasmopsis agassizii]PAK21537.1 hypothetical protein CJJ23_01120 [Mycoplasmopsis agassizii]